MQRLPGASEAGSRLEEAPGYWLLRKQVRRAQPPRRKTGLAHAAGERMLHHTHMLPLSAAAGSMPTHMIQLARCRAR